MTSCELSSSNELTNMDVATVLHMKEGIGETSYAQNSSLQKKNMDILKNTLIESALDVYASQNPQSFLVVDLGCSSGPNALNIFGDIIKAIGQRCRGLAKKPPEFLVFLNDLPTNDFNAMFVSLPELVMRFSGVVEGGDHHKPFISLAGLPGSFYGKLLPSNCVNFFYSCYSLHWLSQVPPGLLPSDSKLINRGKMYISHTSSPAVAAAYFQQFQKDFSLFLRSRSAELISGGQMVLAILGRKSHDHVDRSTTVLWEVLAESFAIMVSQELIDEEKVDMYNVPFYAPSAKEIQDEVFKEGSFVIEKLQVYELSTSSGDADEDARIMSMAIRAIQESMITHHFGGGVMDTLFEIYRENLSELMAEEEIKSTNLIVVLKKSK